MAAITPTPKEHIEEIRTLKFSIGGEQNRLTEDLHHAVKNLSAELYAKDVHFLMEIIQNAEDNEYLDGVKPSLEFVVTSRDITATGAPATLLVFNNEKGFSPKNIESICSVGRSTKKGQRQRGYIGEKGIGFKSVFLITAQPYIFSNGYQIKFSEEPCPHCNVGYIVPEWVEEHPTVADIKKIYGSANSLPTTTIVLPLKPDKVQPVKQQLSSIHPEVLLFLSKIKRLSVREHNENPKLNTVCAVSITSETDFVTRRNVAAESFTLHLSADENSDENETECSYHMWRQRFPVKQENKVDRRMEVEEWVITLAFPIGQRLNRGMSSPGIYAFLPTEMVTNFPFIIQADFVLASSRETILLDNKWNQGILDCVPSAFVNAFISLIKSCEAAPLFTLAPMFQFLPVNTSSYPKLNTVRDSIKEKLMEENIVPSESNSEQKFFYKSREVGRILPSFWSILMKARKQGVSLHNLSSHGKYALSSAFDRTAYDHILDFLEVKQMDNEWYSKCIRSSNLVLGVSEDVYMEVLSFLFDNWGSRFQNTNIKNIPLLKYVGQDGNVSLWSINEATATYGARICLSNDYSNISWLIDWNNEFRCYPSRYFMPKATQEALQIYSKRETVKEWLIRNAEVSVFSVFEYANLLFNSINSGGRRLVIASAQFLYHSLTQNYLSNREVDQLCKKMPLVDNYGSVTTQRSVVLVPANGSNWVGLIGSNPWRGRNYVELAEDYFHAGSFAGLYTKEKQLMEFMKSHIDASDIPNLCPPDDGFPTVSSPLTKENTFLLLDWIRNLRHSGNLMDGKFLRCIKEGCWLRTCLGDSVSYRPPSQSFLLSNARGTLLQNGSELVDIPLVDQLFYGSKISGYKEELKAIGVMFDFGEACQFMGKRLMSLAAHSNLTRSNVFSILKFIRLLREKYLPLEDFIKSIKEGRWLRTRNGDRSPVGSILFDSEWKAASQISNLPFIDHDYYGDEIFSFRVELELLGVIVGFKENYQLVADFFRMPASVTVGASLLILQCIRKASSSVDLVRKLKEIRWLETSVGSRKWPSECYLFNSEWGSLLQIFNGFPYINEAFYGPNIVSYKNELKKLGVVVDFEEAAKVFSGQFKQHASSSSITKENVLLLLACYRQLKNTSYRFPMELNKCIREEKWLKTRLGPRSPNDSILFNSDWGYLSPIVSLPFIDDSDKCYGSAIQEYKDELKAFGVVVDFKDGSKFVVKGLNIPQNPSDVVPTSALSLLKCIQILLEEKSGSLPKEFLERVNSKRWLKTHMGYRSPGMCLLFDSKWSSFLQREDGPFIEEEFYSSKISSYFKELNAIGVTVDVKFGCPLIASQLESHSQLTVITRIYKYLFEFNWEPDNKAASWIFIPNGSNTGEWVSSEKCVLHDKDDLFGLQLHVLEKHYEKKLLDFFCIAFGVRRNPCIDDYCKLWNEWESSKQQLTSAECRAFWLYVAKNWNSKSERLLSEKLVKLPVSTDSGAILLYDKQEILIPDDLQLQDIFEKASSDPLFVWYPQPSFPSVTKSKLNEIYSNIGVRTISESVHKNESSVLDNAELKQVNSRGTFIKRDMIRIILAFLADPSLEMDSEKRHQMVKYLLDLMVFETDEPITVSYGLKLSSGSILNVEVSRMIRWERENMKLFTQKMDRSSSGHKANIEYATYFSEVIAEGLLWEKADQIAGLSELIKLGWLLDFEEAAISFLLKTTNLQLFFEDEEFLNSAFHSD
ncbi:hypothetical protein BVC80_9101g156 [Macleaya cordata]|uniref:Sacsin/Nov domain-containing protein n=1 Tax=Macleaya cordata TaxID=56857 RepID=A0A200QGV4_MACCD|nr:hypothetical protein BVC80_9101g156 [Macleaya cordata]